MVENTARRGRLVRGYTDTPACKLALFMFLGGWVSFGLVLVHAFGPYMWMVWGAACIGLGLMPTVRLIEPVKDQDG